MTPRPMQVLPRLAKRTSTFPSRRGVLRLLAVAAAGAAYVLVLLATESTRPLRRSTESKFVRDARNLSIAALAGLTVQAVEAPIVHPLACRARLRRQGFTQDLPFSDWARDLAAVILLDYTLYIWHVLTHRIPFLWRFHSAHHVDLDCDASTALRFHPGELAVSVMWRSAQIVVLGVSPRALRWWQGFTIASILFHHSNIRLPLRWERAAALIVMTPRLHGIHHSTRGVESNSNWSSGLTVWDRLHGTLRTDIPQETVTIGVPGFMTPRQVTLVRSIGLPLWFSQTPEPFHRQRHSPLRLAP